MNPVMSPMEISRTGLDVEWTRLSVIAQNIANANTVRTSLGEPYRPMRLLSGPRSEFQALLGGATAPQGVAVYGVEPQAVEPRRVLDPANPQADADGFVEYPGLDQAGEMTLLIKTARVYEANITALNLARQMYAKALDIGRRG